MREREREREREFACACVCSLFLLYYLSLKAESSSIQCSRLKLPHVSHVVGLLKRKCIFS